MKQFLSFVLAWIFLFGQVFRHGECTPVHLYPNDPNPVSAWPEGLATLTALGKKQQYALGEYLLERYKNFTTSNPFEVSVNSSEIDPCLKSAETNLASFYASHNKWTFKNNNNNLSSQPVPVHYLPKNQYKDLEVDSDCPRADEEERKVMKSPEGQKFLKEHEEMFRDLSAHSGYSLSNWTKASDLLDVLLMEKKYNLTVPAWVEPYWNELTYVSNLSFLQKINSSLQHRLRAGPQIHRIIEGMNQKINGEIPNRRFQIYSAHDTTIALLLDALNLFNKIPPPYCSALLFELFEKPDGTKTLRVLYLNSSKPEEKIEAPRVLKLEGCAAFCSLDYFVNYTNPLIPEDWNQECQIDESIVEETYDINSLIIWFSILVAIIIAGVSVYLLWRRCSLEHDNKGISSVKYSRLDGP